MTRQVHAILERQFAAKTNEFAFTNSAGKARGYAAKGIFRAFKRAGLVDFRIHDLRHTCASRLIQNGLSLCEVAQMPGHTDVQTTQRYAPLEARDTSAKARDIIDRLSAAL